MSEEDISKKRFPMYTGSILMTLDQLAQAMVPEFSDESRRQKLIACRAIHLTLDQFMSGLGSDIMGKTAWYAAHSARSRVMKLHDGLLAQPEEGEQSSLEKRVEAIERRLDKRDEDNIWHRD